MGFGKTYTRLRILTQYLAVNDVLFLIDQYLVLTWGTVFFINDNKSFSNFSILSSSSSMKWNRAKDETVNQPQDKIPCATPTFRNVLEPGLSAERNPMVALTTWNQLWIHFFLSIIIYILNSTCSNNKAMFIRVKYSNLDTTERSLRPSLRLVWTSDIPERTLIRSRTDHSFWVVKFLDSSWW